MKRSLSILILSILCLPVYANAARLYTTGFEWQSVTAGHEILAANTSPTIDTTTKHSGAVSVEMSGTISAGTVEDVNYTYTSETQAYARWYIYVTQQTNDPAVAIFMDSYSAGTNVVSIQLTGCNGTTCDGITYYNNFGGTLTGGWTITEDAWHYVEMYYDSTPANGSEILTVRVDGSVVDTSSALTFTLKTIDNTEYGIYNGTAGNITDTTVNFDDVAINDTGGTAQISYPGVGNIVALVPNAAGGSACSNSAAFGAVNEVPPSDTATDNTNRCDLDTTTSLAMYNVTDTATAGIDSYDDITLITVMARIREEAAGTSNWFPRIDSSGTATTSGSSVDAGDATARTNPNSTTAFTNMLISYTDPNTSAAWEPSAIDEMELGAGTTDGTPDVWMLTLAGMIEYTDGEAPAAGTAPPQDLIIY